MRLVVSHFYNEAYLLPWWLRHHREIFDHGVLIDSHSTDESAEICRDLVPHWEVVRSERPNFAAIMADFEVMKHEARFPGAWKIALNTTEFLVAPGLTELEAFLLSEDLIAAALPGAILVDDAPDDPPDPGFPLTEQKRSGIWEDRFDFQAAAIPGLKRPRRSRVYHRYFIGAYSPGRHISHLPGQHRSSRDQAAIWWYGYSPWSSAFKQRKLQIAPTLDGFDVRHGWSRQHVASLREFEAHWASLRALAAPLIPPKDLAGGA